MADPAWMAMHEAAAARGETTYCDPETGFVVFTRLGLLARGACCGAGCRHCPYDHESVPLARRSRRIQRPAWLSEARPADPACAVVLFWNGGKDSFLSFRALARAQRQKKGRGEIVFLTGFDATTRAIAHQNIGIEEVIGQANALGVPLIGVPLHEGGDYVAQIAPALDLVPGCRRLAFADLHLEAIRQWREAAFGAHERTAAMALEFPLWGADCEALMADLEASGAQCVVSAVAPGVMGVEVGERFDRGLMARLPAGVDAFGENGEFRTRMVLRG
jgi:ATP-binding cassette subfamily B (MDR/TAP) protein 1